MILTPLWCMKNHVHHLKEIFQSTIVKTNISTQETFPFTTVISYLDALEPSRCLIPKCHGVKARNGGMFQCPKYHLRFQVKSSVKRELTLSSAMKNSNNYTVLINFPVLLPAARSNGMLGGSIYIYCIYFSHHICQGDHMKSL